MADPKHVFISYASEDRGKVAKLADLLEADGWPVWWDREDMSVGRPLNEVIDSAIDESFCVLVCWSKASIKSRWVIDEATEGLDQEKLLPVLFEAVKRPMGFRNIYFINFSEWDGKATHSAYRRLKAELTNRQLPRESITDTRKPAEFRDSKPETFPSNVQTLIERLDDSSTEPEQRLVIGDELARLGDPRPGVGLEAGLPDIDWVEIRGGEFLYGKDKQTRNIETFFIARYPVTNAQYLAFIDDGGYKNKRWWQGLSKRVTEPVSPNWNQSNRPREKINWYEAIAYCRWLSGKLGYAVELPKETQWERAASGTTGRTYPWGDVYKSGYANVNEIRKKAGFYYLEQTSSVGIYPQGASSEGVHELIGNVWEWCLNKYENPENEALEGNVPWVLRGGSWNHDPGYARASSRLRYDPDFRNDNIGFRVVCSSPIKR
ncbi:MAG: SUMF1/EgtB/PvdO family nonheme iron enzyme [Halieaceae bacterium]|nr:SUMF1/EgtB/PvdO family nonheme iron enzyme [Halieaceae bacterium]